jgi:succinate dehydrogenase/fumarate reductase flavoprotein subunit
MTTWNEYLQSGEPVPEWPYPVRYGDEHEIETDVLVLGGGIAGSHAAISAAQKGVRVTVVEKGMVKRSGAGGAGVDHWLGACTNPCSKVTPEEFTEAAFKSARGYTCGPAWYIFTKESWNTLLDCERMGVRIRDADDEFKGADFRDEKTKLLFAYDYANRHSLRVFGYNMKPCLYQEMKRLGVNIFNRVLVTSLLTEGGKQGARVIGATGVNVRTGEFYIFKSKAVVLATGRAGRLWLFAPELIGPAAMGDNELNNAGGGQAIGWNAGAEFVLMEQTTPRSSFFSYAPYSMGNAGNTWFGSPIVDVNGKEVPYFDKDGQEIREVADRFRPARGQKFMLPEGVGLYGSHPDFRSNHLESNLPERIRKGEFTLPLFADLTRLSETERRVIFGMMVGNEGKTRIPVYDTFTKGGFDPDKDMLQAPVMSPEGYSNAYFVSGMKVPNLRLTVGGYMVDWDLKTNLDGLYAAGHIMGGPGGHAGAATQGSYAGRKAAACAMTATEIVPDSKQIKKEKARVYTPIKNSQKGIGWKELNYAIARVMQDYCGRYKNKETLELGLRLLGEIKGNEADKAYAANPHELGRTLESISLIAVGELVMNASLARKASSALLDFYRLDYPEVDPPEWQNFLSVSLEKNKAKVGALPLDYHLKPPYASTYEENYLLHNGL